MLRLSNKAQSSPAPSLSLLSVSVGARGCLSFVYLYQVITTSEQRPGCVTRAISDVMPRDHCRCVTRQVGRSQPRDYTVIQ